MALLPPSQIFILQCVTIVIYLVDWHFERTSVSLETMQRQLAIVTEDHCVLSFFYMEINCNDQYTKQTIRDLTDCLCSRAKAFHCLPSAVNVQVAAKISNVR